MKKDTKQILLIGGLGVGGFLAYRWWQGRQAAEAEEAMYYPPYDAGYPSYAPSGGGGGMMIGWGGGISGPCNEGALEEEGLPLPEVTPTVTPPGVTPSEMETILKYTPAFVPTPARYMPTPGGFTPGTEEQRRLAAATHYAPLPETILKYTPAFVPTPARYRPTPGGFTPGTEEQRRLAAATHYAPLPTPSVVPTPGRYMPTPGGFTPGTEEQRRVAAATHYAATRVVGREAQKRPEIEAYTPAFVPTPARYRPTPGGFTPGTAEQRRLAAATHYAPLPTPSIEAYTPAFVPTPARYVPTPGGFTPGTEEQRRLAAATHYRPY